MAKVDAALRRALAIGAQEHGAEVQADHAAGLAHGLELRIRQVPRRQRDRAGVGMGGHERRALLSDVPEALGGDVAAIDDHPARDVHSRTSARPASVRPGPVSPSEPVRKGTPWAKAFGRDQTGPSDRSPAS
jgi:hypothetical protein